MTQIGQILVQKGYISQQQLDAALFQQGDGQIGQLLISWGWLTKEQLDDALQIQTPPPPPPLVPPLEPEDPLGVGAFEFAGNPVACK